MKLLGLFALVSLLAGCVTPEQQWAAQQELARGRTLGDSMQDAGRALRDSRRSTPQGQTCHIVDVGGGIYRQQCY